MKKIALIVCLIITCSYLLLNTSFARIINNIVENVPMVVDNSDKTVVLLDTKLDDKGKFQYLNSEFKDGKISFYIANGLEEKHSNYDLKAYILVFVSESFGEIYDNENKVDLLKVKIKFNNKWFNGVCNKVDNEEYGSGYLYRFYDNDNECEFNLPGEVFSKEKIQLVLEGTEQFDTEVKIIVKGMLNE